MNLKTASSKFYYQIVFGLILSFLVLSSCQQKSESIPDSYIHAYCEMRLAIELYGHQGQYADTARQEVLKHNDLTESEFIRLGEALKADPSQWKEVQDKVVLYLDTLMAKTKTPKEKSDVKLKDKDSNLKSKPVKSIKSSKPKVKKKLKKVIENKKPATK